MSITDRRIPFEKYHGTGNDFLVVDAGESVPDRAAFASTYCDRQEGVRRADFDDGASGDRRGADGVLFLGLSEGPTPPRIVMTLVQPDGSVAEMCGNGARCAAAWAATRTDASTFMLDTPSGTRRTSIEGDEVVVEMGRPAFAPHLVPLARDRELIATEVEGLPVTAVNTGVPHAVAFVDDATDVALEEVAPAVRHADVFPEGANVTVASPDGDGFRQRTFERGVEAETRSCGTGAVAVAAAARRTGRIAAESIRVSPPGGDLQVTVPDDGPALLCGPVEREFTGELPADPGGR